MDFEKLKMEIIDAKPKRLDIINFILFLLDEIKISTDENLISKERLKNMLYTIKDRINYMSRL
jgi:hypothetical protein